MNRTVRIDIFEVCKYTMTSKDAKNRTSITYKDMERFEVISGNEADDLEKTIDCFDDFHEYLILHFGDGTKATFRNSYVDMFFI